MIGFLALAGIGLGLLLSGRRRARATGTGACDATPAVAAAYTDATRVLAWVDCAGRTGVQVATLTAALRRAHRDPVADDVTRRWNARRAVETAPGDGSVQGAHAAAVAAATSAPTPPAGVPAVPHGTVILPTASEITVTHPAPTEDTEPPATGPDSEGWYTAADGTRFRRAPVLAFPAATDATVRGLAATAAAALRRRTNYRAPLRAFQRAALVAADGIYGGLSQSALTYFGQSPPTAFRRPPASEAPYPPASGPVVTDGGAS